GLPQLAVALAVCARLDNSAVLPAGIHLFPFRTEKLSLPGPMVLGGQPPGRVGRRRFIFVRKEPRKRLFSLRERPSDEPVMPEWIDDAALPPAVRLIRDREHLRRAGRDR